MQGCRDASSACNENGRGWELSLFHFYRVAAQRSLPPEASVAVNSITLEYFWLFRLEPPGPGCLGGYPRALFFPTTGIKYIPFNAVMQTSTRQMCLARELRIDIGLQHCMNIVILSAILFHLLEIFRSHLRIIYVGRLKNLRRIKSLVKNWGSSEKSNWTLIL